MEHSFVSLNEAQAARAIPEAYVKSPSARTYLPGVVQGLVRKFMKLCYIAGKVIGGPGY
jgi:hypothetical protein